MTFRIAGTPYRLTADATLASRIGCPPPPGAPPMGRDTPVLPIPMLDTDTDPGVFGKRWTLGPPAWNSQGLCARSRSGSVPGACPERSPGA